MIRRIVVLTGSLLLLLFVVVLVRSGVRLPAPGMVIVAHPVPPTLGTTPIPPAPHPYDEAADARAAVDAAFIAARTSGRRVMIDFGGNWCPDCRMLAGVLAQPAMHDWAASAYEIAYVDVGRFTKNMDIAAGYGVKITEVPTVLVLTPFGKLLNTGDPAALANARAMSPQAVVDLLAQWSKL